MTLKAYRDFNPLIAINDSDEQKPDANGRIYPRRAMYSAMWTWEYSSVTSMLNQIKNYRSPEFDRKIDLFSLAMMIAGHRPIYHLEYGITLPMNSKLDRSLTIMYDNARIAIDNGLPNLRHSIISEPSLLEHLHGIETQLAGAVEASNIAFNSINSQPGQRDVAPGEAAMILAMAMLPAQNRRRWPAIPHTRPASVRETLFRALLLDIFNNPYQSVEFHDHWLSSTVLDLARMIYDESAFDRMPFLGDALMDAGCDNEAIIKHCQLGSCTTWPELHTHGCWVLDHIIWPRAI